MVLELTLRLGRSIARDAICKVKLGIDRVVIRDPSMSSATCETLIKTANSGREKHHFRKISPTV